MKLGVFSMSLSVKDLNTSKEFYEKLGFNHFAGSVEMKYMVMKNDTTLIGLFQDMFEGNILTFNPGWDTEAKLLDSFEDVRDIQKSLFENGIKVGDPIASEKGRASFTVTDPDGNIILIDQHV